MTNYQYKGVDISNIIQGFTDDTKRLKTLVNYPDLIGSGIITSNIIASSFKSSSGINESIPIINYQIDGIDISAFSIAKYYEYPVGHTSVQIPNGVRNIMAVLIGGGGGGGSGLANNFVRDYVDNTRAQKYRLNVAMYNASGTTTIGYTASGHPVTKPTEGTNLYIQREGYEIFLTEFRDWQSGLKAESQQKLDSNVLQYLRGYIQNQSHGNDKIQISQNNVQVQLQRARAYVTYYLNLRGDSRTRAKVLPSGHLKMYNGTGNVTVGGSTRSIQGTYLGYQGTYLKEFQDLPSAINSDSNNNIDNAVNQLKSLLNSKRSGNDKIGVNRDYYGQQTNINVERAYSYITYFLKTVSSVDARKPNFDVPVYTNHAATNTGSATGQAGVSGTIKYLQLPVNNTTTIDINCAEITSGNPKNQQTSAVPGNPSNIKVNSLTYNSQHTISIDNYSNSLNGYGTGGSYGTAGATGSQAEGTAGGQGNRGYVRVYLQYN